MKYQMKRLGFFIGLVSILWLPLVAANEHATPEVSKDIPTTQFTYKIPAVPTINSSSYILMASGSRTVLAEQNSHERIPPASLTKIMTMYVISQALKSGQLTLDTEVYVSQKAQQAEGSRMFIKAGDKVKAKDLILGIIVASGNDASIAMAEHIAGSEETFVDIMNTEAKRLGMNNTHFMDCIGMPNPNHYSTAYDLAILSHAVIFDFPEYYPWYSEKWFTYNNIKQPNRNQLLWHSEYVDGIKTGHTHEAGYCLAASAKKDQTRLISIVLNTPSEASRAEATKKLLTYGFHFFKTHRLFTPKDIVSQPRIWKGDVKTIQLGVPHNLLVTIPVGQYEQLKITTQLPNRIIAPINKGAKIGTMTVMLNHQLLLKAPLIAKESVGKGSFFSRLSDSISMIIHGATDDDNESQ